MSSAATIEHPTAAVDLSPIAQSKFRFAVKTALSLTLAYLLPMAWGWSQPQTAAITVMLIAATGGMAESIQKGLLRIIGTLAGACIGLLLIALMPQDRLLYLGTLSLVVSLCLYLYSCYRGDNSVFMLTMVVSLMVFNGGDAEGAFLYGIDRTLLTIFGVMIYSLVGSILWQVSVVDQTRQLAHGLNTTAAAVMRALLRKRCDQSIPEVEADSAEGSAENNPANNTADGAVSLFEQLQALRTNFNANRRSASDVAAYDREWQAMLDIYGQMESFIIPALSQESAPKVTVSSHIRNYAELIEHIDTGLKALSNAWISTAPSEPATAPMVDVDEQSLAGLPQAYIAVIIYEAQLLEQLQIALTRLQRAVDSIRFDRNFDAGKDQPLPSPAFIWLDREAVKTAVRGFTTFWLASLIWIAFNPPGGFMFVTLCTALVPLVSYTPVGPKLLFFLFTLGFGCALPAYVFLLPNMTHWLELALFIFSYAFIGFFVFPGAVAIFFLFGLFSLGIQNEMQYSMAVILQVMLMFYMICALLIFAMQRPFRSRMPLLYSGSRSRFFGFCASLTRGVGAPPTGSIRLGQWRIYGAEKLLQRMAQWGAAIDTKEYSRCPEAAVTEFNHACENLLSRLRLLQQLQRKQGPNPLLKKALDNGLTTSVSRLCAMLAQGDDGLAGDQQQARLEAVEQELEALFTQSAEDNNYSHSELVEFYIYLNTYWTIGQALDRCRRAMGALDWQQLKESRF